MRLSKWTTKIFYTSFQKKRVPKLLELTMQFFLLFSYTDWSDSELIQKLMALCLFLWRKLTTERFLWKTVGSRRLSGSKGPLFVWRTFEEPSMNRGTKSSHWKDQSKRSSVDLPKLNHILHLRNTGLILSSGGFSQVLSVGFFWVLRFSPTSEIMPRGRMLYKMIINCPLCIKVCLHGA